MYKGTFSAASAEGESPFSNGLVLRGLDATWFQSIAYRDGVIGVHAPRLANTPGQPLETGCSSFAQGLAPPASCFSGSLANPLLEGSVNLSLLWHIASSNLSVAVIDYST